MKTDEALQIIERQRLGNVRRKHLLDCAANIHGRVQQGTIEIDK